MDELSYYGTILSILLIIVSLYWFHNNENASKRIIKDKTRANSNSSKFIDGRNKVKSGKS